MRRVALIALLALAASACTIDINVGGTLSRNGSGSLAVDIKTDAEFEELFRLTGGEFENLVATRGAELGLAFTVEPGSNTRYAASTSNLAAETVAEILDGLAPGSSQATVSRDATTLEFDAQLNPLTDDVAPYFDDADLGQFVDDVAIQVTLDMDGDIDSSTADGRDGDQLVWNVPFADSETRLFARSILEKESAGVPWTVVIVGGILVVAALFLVAIRSNLPGPEEAARPGSPPQPTGQASPPAEKASPPEDQAIAPDATPPEDQPVAPPDEG
ncbi:MAG: hypothetical protein HKN80_08050 [Acidimicrobiia bacterium]|nr:hypothetical protein [Acidimicrobiia bacterium]